MYNIHIHIAPLVLKRSKSTRIKYGRDLGRLKISLYSTSSKGSVKIVNNFIKPLNAKFIKWSSTLKQIVGKLPTICLSVFDHFSGLALKGLRLILIMYIFRNNSNNKKPTKTNKQTKKKTKKPL